MRKSLAFALSVAVLMSGCGGGGGSSAGSGAGGTLTLGDATLTYDSAVKPAVSTSASGAASTVAVSGANFTSLIFNPPKDETKLPILITSGGTLYSCANMTLSQISTGDTPYAYYAAFTPAGQIVFVGYDTATSSFKIYSCNVDGTGLRVLSSSPYLSSDGRIGVSADGKFLIYGNQFSNILTANADGSGEALASVTGNHPSWSTDDVHILYESLDGWVHLSTTKGAGDIRLAHSWLYPTISPNGKYLAGIGSGQIQVTDTLGHNSSFGSAGAAGVQPSFSPDGRFLAYDDASGALTVASWTLTNPTHVLNQNLVISSISWFPFLRPKLLIGASASVAASASGFLLNQCNNVFSSLFTFVAKTPTTANLQPADSGSSSSVFRASGDSVLSYRYVNAYNGGVIAGAPAAGTTQMLVSVDSTTGQIGFIAPYTASRKSSTQSRSGNLLTVDAAFGGVFDRRGKNLAPGGASRLTCDLRSGKLISVR